MWDQGWIGCNNVQEVDDLRARVDRLEAELAEARQQLNQVK